MIFVSCIQTNYPMIEYITCPLSMVIQIYISWTFITVSASAHYIISIGTHSALARYKLGKYILDMKGENRSGTI